MKTSHPPVEMAHPAPRERWFGAERRQRLRNGARHHWVFLVVLGVGALLRIVTQLAYRPALLYIDSFGYLGNLHDLNPARTSQPIGYELFVLRPVLSVGTLAAVAAVQHLAGLAMGVAIYAVLVRLGARRWIAVLAAVPVLFDAYQLQIEQLVMSETLFEVLILAAVVLLLWKRPLTLPVLATGGVLFGLTAMVRAVGVILVIPGVVFAFVAGSGGRQRLVRAATVGLAFLVVLASYAGYYWIKAGNIAVSRGDAYLLYGRAATIVNCRELELPDYERVLCPPEPLDDRHGINEYAHHSPYPGRVHPPPGKDRDAVLRDFARRVFIHQPSDFVRHVATDVGKGFSWPRITFPEDPPLDRWQFQRQYPHFGEENDAAKAVRHQGGGRPSVIEPLAVFLRDYQLTVGYTPGPVLGLAFIAGLLGMFGVGRARRSGLRAACALPTLCGLSVLLAADVFIFSWRYQLPALILAPLAGALGVTALTSRVIPPSRSSSPAADRLDARGLPSGAS